MAVQRQVVGSLGEGLAALREGRLTATITQTFPGEYEQLRTDFNAALSSLADLMRQVAGTAQAVRSGANEISAAASDLAVRTQGRPPALRIGRRRARTEPFGRQHRANRDGSPAPGP
jgi:methyl-accepting chemotaxis protein